jgi:hypothetical protein
VLRIKKSLLTMFSHQLQGLVAPGIKTAIAADSSPVPTAHSTVTSRTRVPGPTFCCLGGGPVSSAALMASRFRVSSTACGFGAYSRSVDPNLPLLGTGSQFDTLSAGLRSNLSVLEGPESPIASRPDEGPLTEPTAAAQPSSPEPLNLPLSSHRGRDLATARSGGKPPASLLSDMASVGP